jgi:hypothetical protein
MNIISEEQLFNIIKDTECSCIYFHNNLYMFCHVSNYQINHISTHSNFKEANNNMTLQRFLQNTIVVKYN